MRESLNGVRIGRASSSGPMNAVAVMEKMGVPPIGACGPRERAALSYRNEPESRAARVLARAPGAR
jgi:hypothetical protein